MTRFALRSLLALLSAVLLYAPATPAAEPDASFVSARWNSLRGNPRFTGREGRWDDLIRERGWVMKDDNTWKLWYTGYNKEQTPLTMRMGYATSEDGITWTRWSDDPIYDEHWIEDMMIVRQDGRYFMFAEGAKDQPQLLESDDGIHWTRIETLDVRRADGTPIEPGPYGTPTVFVEDGVWHLFYERRDQGIWLATSTDRRVWTNVSDDPLIVPGPDEYDARMIAMNQVLRIDDRYYAVLHGTGTPEKPRQWCTYLAESPDLRHWTKLERGPVVPVEGNKSSGILVHTGAAWRLYTMHAQMDVWIPEF